MHCNEIVIVIENTVNSLSESDKDIIKSLRMDKRQAWQWMDGSSKIKTNDLLDLLCKRYQSELCEKLFLLAHILLWFKAMSSLEPAILEMSSEIAMQSYACVCLLRNKSSV